MRAGLLPVLILYLMLSIFWHQKTGKLKSNFWRTRAMLLRKLWTKWCMRIIVASTKQFRIILRFPDCYSHLLPFPWKIAHFFGGFFLGVIQLLCDVKDDLNHIFTLYWFYAYHSCCADWKIPYWVTYSLLPSLGCYKRVDSNLCTCKGRDWLSPYFRLSLESTCWGKMT